MQVKVECIWTLKTKKWIHEYGVLLFLASTFPPFLWTNENQSQNAWYFCLTNNSTYNYSLILLKCLYILDIFLLICYIVQAGSCNQRAIFNPLKGVACRYIKFLCSIFIWHLVPSLTLEGHYVLIALHTTLHPNGCGLDTSKSCVHNESVGTVSLRQNLKKVFIISGVTQEIDGLQWEKEKGKKYKMTRSRKEEN